MSAQADFDLNRLAQKARRPGWTLDDLDFTHPPTLSPEDEATVVQYLTDFVMIERMAGAFFHALSEKVLNPTAREVLLAFVADETRHAYAMQRLADYYDVHKLRIYAPNPWIIRLVQRLEEWSRVVPPDSASVGVTVGEICFDVAYLKPLEEYLNDPTAREVLRRIHRDESLHLALDYWLLEHFSEHSPSFSWLQHAEIAWRYARAFQVGFPFMRNVFFGTNARLDHSGVRLREAAKRIQLALDRPAIASRPTGKFFHTVQAVFDHSLTGPVARRAFAGLLGADPALFRTQATAAERERARTSSVEDVARDTVAAFFDFGEI